MTVTPKPPSVPVSGPGVKNKTLLLVAIGLAVAVVFVYLFQINMIKDAKSAGLVDALEFTRNVDRGKTIKPKDVRVIRVERTYARKVGNPIRREDFETVYGTVAMDTCYRGKLVEYRHIAPSNRDLPSRSIPRNMVAVPLEIDPRFVPGDILRVGDRVNVIAILQVGTKAPQAYRVIYELPVRAIGGRGEKPRTLRTDKPTRSGFVPSSYRTVTVAVPIETALQMTNVLTHAIGSVRLELCSTSEDVKAHRNREKINPELKSLAKAASVIEQGR